MEMIEKDGQITFVLDSGNKVSYNKEFVTEFGQTLGRLYRLEKTFKRVMENIPSDEIAEIVEAWAEGRLTIWPREGQMLWYDAKGMCEGCPLDAKCKGWDDESWLDKCPSYVGCEPWKEEYKKDADEIMYILEGQYFRSREACEQAIREKQEGKK